MDRRRLRHWLCTGLAATLLLQGQTGIALAGALERAMLGKSAVVELSHPLAETALESGNRDGVSPPPITRLHAPAGALPRQRTVAEIPVRELIFPAVVVDIKAKADPQGEYAVGVEEFQGWERAHGRIPRRSMVLLRTGSRAGAGSRPPVPLLRPAALAFLLQQREVRAVGQDAPLVDSAAGSGEAARTGRPGAMRVENLTNLDRLPPKGAKLVVAPLRMTGGSAPARVFAILP